MQVSLPEQRLIGILGKRFETKVYDKFFNTMFLIVLKAVGLILLSTQKLQNQIFSFLKFNTPEEFLSKNGL